MLLASVTTIRSAMVPILLMQTGKILQRLRTNRSGGSETRQDDTTLSEAIDSCIDGFLYHRHELFVVPCLLIFTQIRCGGIGTPDLFDLNEGTLIAESQ